jgi:hypothetical protein
LLLVGAPHFVVVDHGLGQLGRARGEQELGDGVGPGGLHGGIHRSGGLGRQQVGKQGAALGIDGRLAVHHLAALGQHGAYCLVIAHRIGCEDQTGRERLDHMAQLGVIGADQRIGRGDRAIGNARIQAAHGQHGMVQVVLAEDDDGTLAESFLSTSACAMAAPLPASGHS